MLSNLLDFLHIDFLHKYIISTLKRSNDKQISRFNIKIIGWIEFFKFLLFKIIIEIAWRKGASKLFGSTSNLIECIMNFSLYKFEKSLWNEMFLFVKNSIFLYYSFGLRFRLMITNSLFFRHIEISYFISVSLPFCL